MTITSRCPLIRRPPRPDPADPSLEMTIDTCRLSRYPEKMIQSFRHKGLKRLFEDGDRKGIRADYVEKVENILAVLNRARMPEDINLPGFRLHPLKGSLKGFYAVTVRANYRVTFRFEDGHAYDVDFVDYH
ncbi:MAG: type II toxin-antitoxin system RelE/ParE family toxin [Nitrospira sp.]|nr:type II toxin-antitoxin system RelE/ParE family toxin [Nitrospira sp.]